MKNEYSSVIFLHAVLSGIVGCWEHLPLYKKLSHEHLQLSACFVNLSNFTFMVLPFPTVNSSNSTNFNF